MEKKVSFMKYHHNLHFDYPEKLDGHMIAPEQVGHDVLDANFKYYDKSKWLRFKQWGLNLAFVILVYWVNYVRYGLKIHGRNVKHKYKDILKNGYVTVCNHITEWDYIFVRSAMRCKRGYVTIWDQNHNGPLGQLMRAVGSIPIPDRKDYAAMAAFSDGVNQCLQDKNWVQFYAEGSMWYYYEGLRPFKPGAFSFAVKNNKPIIPLAISYRPAKGLFKLWKHNYPTCDIEICEPIFPDPELNSADNIKQMMEKCREEMLFAMNKNTPNVHNKKELEESNV